MATSSLMLTNFLQVFLICLLLSNGTQANPASIKRYTTTFVAPSGYRSSWGIDNRRLSYNASGIPYLSRTALRGSSVGQPQVNACASRCEQTLECGFFHAVEMKGSSDGNVMCALYRGKVGKSSAAFSSGSGSTPGKVTFSYGFTRNSGSVSKLPVSSSTSKSSSSISSRTSSTATTFFTSRTSQKTSSTSVSSIKTSFTTTSQKLKSPGPHAPNFTTPTSTTTHSKTPSSRTTSITSASTLSTSTSALPSTSAPASTYAPPGYSISWEASLRRLSYGASTGAYLTRATLSGDVLDQKQIDECGQHCESLKGCGFFHPILFSNSSDGNVFCALYNATVPQDKANFSSGTGMTPGKVVKSYGYARLDGPVSTVSTPTSSLSYPSSPTGASLVEYQPCEGTRAHVPMFVNKAWSNSSMSLASKAFIITHGAGRDFDQAFTDVYPLIGDNDVLVAPVFYLQSDTPTFSPTTGRQSNWFLPNSTLGWESTRDTAGGSDAVYPSEGSFAASGTSCSTFNVYDSLISLFGDKAKYPFLHQVNVIGHSNGAGTTARYSVIAPAPPSGIALRFSLANTPTSPYFTRDRPWAYSDEQASSISRWMYGFESDLSPYVAARMTDPQTLFADWAARDVRTITGDLDTFSRYNFGDTSLAAMVTGGDRRDRGYAYWAYRNLLAGTNTDVSAYYGYGNLTTLNGGVQPLNVPVFNHQDCVVDGVGHVGNQMWASDCGRAALFDSKLPAGSPPLRP